MQSSHGPEKIKTLAIETPITVHTQRALQRYADGKTETGKERKSAGATQVDLWVIMAHEYV